MPASSPSRSNALGPVAVAGAPAVLLAAREKVILQPGRVHLRHIKKGLSSNPGAVQVLDTWFAPQPRDGVNGPRGFISGSYERRLGEEGSFSLTFPNAEGEDGVLHRERFLTITDGKRIADTSSLYGYRGGAYRPGDEWIEIYWGDPGTLMFVGTPYDATVRRDRITITGFDAFALMKKERDTSSAFWTHSPRDVFEFYTQAWDWVEAYDWPVNGTSYGLGDTTQTSTDNKFTYRRASTDFNNWPGRLRFSPSSTVASMLTSVTGLPVGLQSSQPFAAWRVEAEVNVSAIPSADITMGLLDPGIFLRLSASEMKWVLSSESPEKRVEYVPQAGNMHLVVEGRERWIYYFCNGKLLGVMPMAIGNYGSAKPFLGLSQNSAGTTMDINFFVIRHTRPLLLSGGDKGDYHLPGVAPSGGLVGAYFNDQDLYAPLPEEPGPQAMSLNPLREPYVRRQDSTINFPEATPPLWQPPGPANGTRFSVRWTGAIYLDLATNDRFLRLTLTDSGRMWIGKTLRGQEIIFSWTAGAPRTVTSSSLRVHLDSKQVSGWYPIVIEYSQDAGSAGIQMLWSTTSGGSYTIVPADKLSPLGVFINHSRHESHFDQMKNMMETYGYQFTLEPHSLESKLGTQSLFPGQLAPKVRVGRDTAKVLDAVESTDIGVEIHADETADILIADAAGIADPRQANQLTAESFNFLEVNNHFVINSEYTSLADITIPELLRTRLDSNLALRGSAWEQVSAQPHGFRELIDKFLLPGNLALFNWEPGDGIKVVLPEIGVKDLTPRQILGIARQFTPNGFSRPTVNFRQRPRSLGDLLRSFNRTTLQQIRNYQGQIVMTHGTMAGTNLTDMYSRVSLPNDISDVVSAWIVVIQKSDTSTWTVEVNDTNTITVTTPGRYPINEFVSRLGTTDPRMYARLVGGTGSVSYQVEILVRI